MFGTIDRRRFLVGTAAVAGAINFIGMPSARAQATGTLKFGLSSYPPSFNAWASAGTAAGTVKLFLHRGLLSYDPDGKLRGELAEQWDVDDDGVWTFKLRDATFHNGKPVTAEDVKWNIEQVAAEDFHRLFPRPVPDDHQDRDARRQDDPPDDQEADGDRPDVVRPLQHADHPRRARRPTAMSAQGPSSSTAPSAASPSPSRPTRTTTRTACPSSKGLEAIVYSDENLRVAALQAGDIDLIEYVPWQSMQAVEDDQNLKLDAVDGPFMYLTFNGSKKPFDDPKVRKAIAHAIKREDVVAAAFYGRGGDLTHLPISEASEFYNKDLVGGWAYDPDLAKKLLAEAGHPNGFSCSLLSTAQYGMHQSTAEVCQAYLAQVGINVQLNLPDWSQRVSLGNSGQYDMAVMGTSADSNDPDGLSNILDGTLPPSYARSYKLAVPEVDQALAEGRTEFDLAKRKEIYHRMEAAAIESAPIVGLCWRSQGYGMKKAVNGFHNLPGQLTFYSGVTLEQTELA